MAELRRLLQHCKFEAMLDDMLHDRLVYGIQDVRLQRRLMEEAEFSFARAFEAVVYLILRHKCFSCSLVSVLAVYTGHMYKYSGG